MNTKKQQKAQFFSSNIEFLGTKIGNGKIKLQPHISKKVLEFSDKIDETKELQQVLGLLNYARPFVSNPIKSIGPLYSKTSIKGQNCQKNFN